MDLFDEKTPQFYFYFKAGKATERQQNKVFMNAEKILKASLELIPQIQCLEVKAACSYFQSENKY